MISIINYINSIKKNPQKSKEFEKIVNEIL